MAKINSAANKTKKFPSELFTLKENLSGVSGLFQDWKVK